VNVVTGETSLREDLGWGLPMLQRFCGLREVLDEAVKRGDWTDWTCPSAGCRACGPSCMQQRSSLLNCRPDRADALVNLGASLHSLRHLDEAEDACRQALEIDPNLAEAHYNLGEALLLQGKFAAGCPEYEWRHELNKLTASEQNGQAGSEPGHGGDSHSTRPASPAIRRSPTLPAPSVFRVGSRFRIPPSGDGYGIAATVRGIPTTACSGSLELAIGRVRLPKW
jgi:tetratricopeptide (TPR) repeat protein